MSLMLSQDSRILGLSAGNQAATIWSRDKASLAAVVREGNLEEVP